MMPKGAKFWTDYSGELMQPDLTEENRLDIWLEAKTMKEGVAGEELQAVKDKIGNTTVVDMDEKKTIRFKYNRYTPPTLFLVFVNKNIAVLLNPCTLLSLQVDVRSTNGIKVGGLKPLITYQYDRLTQIRAGASFLPGVSALIVGCKRDIGSGL
jgi:hypothetical protein